MGVSEWKGSAAVLKNCHCDLLEVHPGGVIIAETLAGSPGVVLPGEMELGPIDPVQKKTKLMSPPGGGEVCTLRDR